MKTFIFQILACLLIITACAKDNYDDLDSIIKGQVIYNGNPVGLRSNGVQLELWQHGHKLYSKIPVYVSQEGSFTAAVKSGEYKLVLLRGNGPWVDDSDSIDVDVSGTTTVNVEVDPYFVINSESFQKTGTSIASTFTIQQVNTTRQLESVRLFLSKTTIVDQTNNMGIAQLAASAIADINQPISLELAIPSALANNEYLFARVGVKTAGVAELIYSPVQKIQLK